MKIFEEQNYVGLLFTTCNDEYEKIKEKTLISIYLLRCSLNDSLILYTVSGEDTYQNCVKKILKRIYARGDARLVKAIKSTCFAENQLHNILIRSGYIGVLI